MSLALTLTDAIVTKLNAGTFTETFTAARKFVPRRVDSEFTGVMVDAIPTPQGREVETRATVAKTQTVAIVVDRKVDWDQTVDDANQSQCDEVIVTAEEIADHLLGASQRVITSGDVTGYIMSAEIGQGVELLDQELLHDYQLARCIIAVQVRVN